ncbi:unnamed protein product, partial [Musa acuminata var. zebrina]
MRLAKRLHGQIHAVACLFLLPLNRCLRFTFGIQFFSKISEKKLILAGLFPSWGFCSWNRWGHKEGARFWP